MNAPEIQTERLLIRRFIPSDGADFAEILTDPEVCYFEPYEVFGYDAAVKEAENLSRNESFWAVILKEQNKLIGKLYFHDEDFFGAWELGYTFHRHFWGQGYASEAVRAMMQYAFTELHVRRIIASADVKKIRSCRLLERVGFRREGIFVKSAAYQTSPDGEPVWSDYGSYAILNDEYAGGRS